jgi:hypothetical protein
MREDQDLPGEHRDQELCIQSIATESSKGMILTGNSWEILGQSNEPEAALSVSRQFALLRILAEQVQTLGSQFLISTHSPILLSYPDSTIYRLDETGIAPSPYDQAESVAQTIDFLSNREVYVRELTPEYYARKKRR